MHLHMKSCIYAHAKIIMRKNCKYAWNKPWILNQLSKVKHTGCQFPYLLKKAFHSSIHPPIHLSIHPSIRPSSLTSLCISVSSLANWVSVVWGSRQYSEEEISAFTLPLYFTWKPNKHSRCYTHILLACHRQESHDQRGFCAQNLESDVPCRRFTLTRNHVWSALRWNHLTLELRSLSGVLRLWCLRQDGVQRHGRLLPALLLVLGLKQENKNSLSS